MIKNMVMVPLSGPTAANILENGVKANSTVKAYTSKKVKSAKEFGKWVRGLNGSKPRRHQLMELSSESPSITNSIPYFLLL